MHGNRPAGVLLLLAALLLPASASPDVGAYGGRVVISNAAAKGTNTDMASATLTTRLEDEVAPELRLNWEASLQAISYDRLEPSRPACLGPCPAPGQPYTGHGCQHKYRARC